MKLMGTNVTIKVGKCVITVGILTIIMNKAKFHTLFT